MEKVTCHICDYENKSQDTKPTFCIRCGTDLIEENEEKLLLQALHSATYATADKITALALNGFIYLTDKRLIVIPAKMQGFGLSGALTASVYNKMTSASGVISVPFEQIKSVRDGKFGLLVKALIIETNNEELVKIKVPKLKNWKDMITKYMNQTL